jgi:replicative superfamily II helicase
MQLSDLEKYGIPRQIIEIWRERQGETLLPVQARAIQRGLLGDGISNDRNRGAIISAPTSSGKTFCAELAAIKAILDRRRVVMLFPLKSLAEQKHAHFERSFGPLGIRSLIVSGDHPENDRAFRDGDFQIAFAIYEKFDMLLTCNLDALGNVGLVVVDELQTIGEPGRGAVLERLLTKIVASVYEPSLIALSAVIGDDSASAGRLANWLKATLVEETRRPVDLLRGVAAEGSFRFRSYNSGIDGTESCHGGDDLDDPFQNLIQQLQDRSEQTLVFLKSRADTVGAALRLAAAVSWPVAEAAGAALDDEEPSALIRSLRQVMQHGVAFHSSDLSSRQRAIVEQAFCDGSVTAIFSTTTLSMGVDLPAEVVYLETVKYASGAYGDRPHLVPVSRAEFDNMTGRAGRLRPGRPTEPGRAVVLAQSELDREILWRQYIAPDTSEAVQSVMSDHAWPDWILNMVVSGLGRSQSALQNIVASTYLASDPSHKVEVNFDDKLQRLIELDMIVRDEREQICATPLGRAIATVGLTLAQGDHYWQALQQGSPHSRKGWLALALSSPDWCPPPGIINTYDRLTRYPFATLQEHLDGSHEELGWLLNKIDLSQPLSYRQAAALKAVFLVDQWSRMAPVRQLEERFHIHLGQIISLGETAAHLLHGLRRLVAVADPAHPQLNELDTYVFEARHGLSQIWLPVFNLLGSTLTRTDYQALAEAGLDSPEALRDTSDEALAELGLSDSKIDKINKLVPTLKEEHEMNSNFQVASRDLVRPVIPMSGQPESVEVDGECYKERFLIRINGFPVRLTGKSFKYFTRLAWSRLHSESGWVYKEDLESGFNQARYLYRLKNEIAATFTSSWAVIENNRLGYYRLDVDPSRISIDLDKVRNHPDYEVNSLALGGDDMTAMGHG